MVAGDNLFEFDIRKYVAFAAAKKELSIALYDVNDRELAKKYGIVKIDPAGKIVDFEEKPEEPKSTLASTGIYYLPAGKVQKVREYMSTGNKKDAPGNFVKWLAGTDGAYGFVFTEGWYDIGDIDSYHKADKEYFKKKI
jgi:glucose-1-phosphate thymidylyltransferase